jgi:GTP-binding protein
VLRQTLELRLPVILVVNKIDRPDARISEVVDEAFDLMIDLGADDDQIDLPIVYTNAKAGTATLDLDEPGTDLDPLFDVLLETVPAPTHDPDHPFQAMVSSLTADPYVGRIAVARVRHGTVKQGKTVAWSRLDGSIEHAKVAELYLTEALDRVEVDEAGPGDIIQVAGFEDITVGETLTDPEDPRPLPPLSVDEPSLSMTIGVNTSPLSGRDGDKVTARLLENRLQQELVGNVSLRVNDTERPDVWEVQGRGELQLAILVETMRREGFELTVGKPEVVTREIDGTIHEPVEHLSIDVPDDYVGVVTQLLGLRKGRMLSMQSSGSDGGWSRVTFKVPARGLIGFRTEFLTETRGTGIIHGTFDGWEPWFGDITTRPNGSLVADRTGTTTQFALLNLQDRGQMFVGPGVDVYEGMIIGENARDDDLDVNPTKEKKLTNVRAASADELVRLAPPRQLSLEQALEWIRGDEAVEVTPQSVRLRKVELDQTTRARAAKRARRGDAPS